MLFGGERPALEGGADCELRSKCLNPTLRAALFRLAMGDERQGPGHSALFASFGLTPYDKAPDNRPVAGREMRRGEGGFRLEEIVRMRAARGWRPKTPRDP